jgi:hypothetical protein
LDICLPLRHLLAVHVRMRWGLPRLLDWPFPTAKGIQGERRLTSRTHPEITLKRMRMQARSRKAR